MKFANKGLTLKNLSRLDKYRKLIPNLILINIDSFYKNKEYYKIIIKRDFKKKIVIRSSALSEDTSQSSNAGKFKSFLNISPSNFAQIEKSIHEINLSFKNNKTNGNIIIQEMENNTQISGVITTAIISNLNNNYFEINYSKGNNTEIVTSGKYGTKNLIISKYYENFNNLKPFGDLLKISNDLIKLFNNPYLDIEFAITKKNKIRIFQVRPIVTNKRKHIKANLKNNLSNLNKKINKLQKPNSNIIGKTTYFGLMADWNPAEIIGTKPKALSFSLYKELITNNIWSLQRANYGFNQLKDVPLMVNFFGTPYIDIRVDFNSWLPNELNYELKEKLMDYYLNKYKSNREFHDKIEFKIIFTCKSFLSTIKLDNLKKYNFTKSEIKLIDKSLIDLTVKAKKNLLTDINKINLLEKKQKKIINSNLDYLQKIFFLNQNCKLFGTLPFAGLARNGFIAIELLNSLLELNVINDDERNSFLNSISNITTDLKNDFIFLSKKKFIDKYGHLRPNTYDIETKNYSEGFDIYFNSKKNTQQKISKKRFTLSLQKRNLINHHIKKSNLPFTNSKDLFKYIKKSIEYRELSKFIFTKSISNIFDQIILLGKRLNIPRSDLSHLDFSLILSKYSELNTVNLSDIFKSNILLNKNEYYKNLSIPLPELILNPVDIYLFSYIKFSGNYTGEDIVSGSIYHINTIDKQINLDNKIVLIKNADPGYDFIFNYKISGLITCYGGSNSHMAIRCSELNITGIIGIGEIEYSKLLESSKILINPINKIYSLI